MKSKKLKRAAEILNTLGEPTRLAICQALLDFGPLTPTQLQKRLKKTQSAIGTHMGVLRMTRLVTVVKDGRLRWYEIKREAEEAMRNALGWIRNLASKVPAR